MVDNLYGHLTCVITTLMDFNFVPETNMCIGLDQICWHNFRIIGTIFSVISTENNSRIIGSYLDI